MFRKDAIVAGTLLLIAIVVFSPLFDATLLLWDDLYHLSRNPFLLTGDLAALWSSPYLGLFVPVTQSVWYFVWHFVSKDPLAFHLLNILVHTANACLVFWFLERRSFSFWSASLGSLIFLLHPLQVESVAWVSELRTLLATFFGLLAIHLWLNRHRMASVLGLLFFAASILAKPIFVLLPLAMMIDFARGEKERKVNHTPFLVSAFLSLLLAGLVSVLALSIQPSRGPEYFTRGMRTIDSLGWFIEKLFWPLPLLMDYSRTVGTIVSNQLWIVALVLIGAGVIVTYVLSRRDPRVRLGWLILIAAWIPTSGLFHYSYQDFTSVADRYNYALMIGVAVISASLFERVGRTMGRSNLLQIPSAFLVMMGLTLLAFLTNQQADVWKNDESLTTHTLESNPPSYFAHLFYGQVLVNKGDLVQGLIHLETAKKLQPQQAAPVLGMMLAKTQAQDHSQVVKLGGLFLADPNVLKANKESPLMFEILSTMGYNLALVGRVEDAQKVLCHAMQGNPLRKIDASTLKNLKGVEELLTTNQKPFQPCTF